MMFEHCLKISGLCPVSAQYLGRGVCGRDKFIRNNAKVYSRAFRQDGILFVDGIPEDVKCREQMNQRERLKMKDARRTD